jgi:hypothetical protein
MVQRVYRTGVGVVERERDEDLSREAERAARRSERRPEQRSGDGERGIDRSIVVDGGECRQRVRERESR